MSVWAAVQSCANWLVPTEAASTRGGRSGTPARYKCRLLTHRTEISLTELTQGLEDGETVVRSHLCRQTSATLHSLCVKATRVTESELRWEESWIGATTRLGDEGGNRAVRDRLHAPRRAEPQRSRVSIGVSCPKLGCHEGRGPVIHCHLLLRKE